MAVLRILILVAVGIMTGCSSDPPVSSGWGSETTNGVTATLRYPDGSPVSGAKVRLRPVSFLHGDSTTTGAIRDTISDARGAFTFTEITPGHYAVDIMADSGYGLLIKASPGTADSSWIDFGVTSVRKTGSIRGSVRMVNIPEEAALIARMYGLDRSAPVDKQGRYGFINVAPGIYTIRIASDDVRVGAVDIPSVNIEEGADTDVPQTGMPIDYRVDSIAVRTYLEDQGLHTIAWEEVTNTGDNNRIRHLNLSDKSIENVHPTIATLDFLWTIDLSGNPLERISPELSSTGVLNLVLNRIPMDTLIPGIGQFDRLATLSLDSTGIRDLSNTLVDLDLKHLVLSGNQLTKIPERVLACTTLTSLNMQRNELSSMNGIERLYKLQYIDFGWNRIDSIPEIISTCGDLGRFRLNDNSLVYIPKTLGECANLTSLWLHHNNLVELPSEVTALRMLHTLRVERNPLPSLPDSIGSLSKLKKLYFRYNPIQVLPESIVKLTDISVRAGDCQICDPTPTVAQWLDIYDDSNWRSNQRGCE